MRRVSTTIAVMLVTALAVIGCMAPDGSFIDSDGNVLLATPEEVQQAQETLLSIQSKADMLPSMNGGVLFDGTVKEIQRRTDGSEAAKLVIARVISGPFNVGEEVRVQTPSVERGGVQFEPDKRFRIFAVELDGVLRTWASAGTVRMD